MVARLQFQKLNCERKSCQGHIGHSSRCRSSRRWSRFRSGSHWRLAAESRVGQELVGLGKGIWNLEKRWKSLFNNLFYNLHTFRQSAPTQAPTRLCTIAISTKMDYNNVAFANKRGRHKGAASPLQQNCSIGLSDGEVVKVTCGLGLDVKFCEF